MRVFRGCCLPFRTVSLLSLIMVLLLTGCAKTETEVTIYANEHWAGQMTIEVPPETVGLVGGLHGLEQRLTRQVTNLKNKGIVVVIDQESDQDGGMVINGQVEGDTLDQLNQTFFDGQADISLDEAGGQRQVTIRRNYPANQTGVNIIKVRGGQIISSNADQIEGNTAIWTNPTSLEVTLIGAGAETPWLWWGVGFAFGGLVCFGVVGLIALGGFFWYQQRQAA